MKKIKILAIVPVFLFVFALSGCNFQRDLNTFWTQYTLESRNLNYLFANNTRETQFMGNTISGLMETDRWGNLQPALADPNVFTRDDNSLGVDGFNQREYTREDGTTVYEFEFVIRTNQDGTPLQWVDYRGREVADITADDWIAAAQWILNPFNNSENVNIWIQLIYGVQDYRNKLIALQQQIVDANQEYGSNHATTQALVAQFQNYINNIEDYVGIRVERNIDGREKLIFTSNGALRFMPRSLTANAFFPVNRAFLEERSGFFARTYRDVLFNGGYRITSHSRFNSLVMERNESYWDVDNVFIPRIHMRFLATNDPSTQRVLFENNELDEFIVNMNDRVATERYVFGPAGQSPDNPYDQTNPYHEGAFAMVEDGAFVRPGIFNFTRSFEPESAHPNVASLQNTQNALLVREFRQSFVFGIDWVTFIREANAASFTGYDWRTSMWTLPGLASIDVDGIERDYSWFFAREFMRMRTRNGDGTIFGSNYDYNNPDHVEEVRRNLIHGGTEDLVFFEEIAKRFIISAYEELVNEQVTFPILIEIPTPQAPATHTPIVEQAAYIAKFWNEILREELGDQNFEFVRFEATQATSAQHWSQLISGQFDFKFPVAGWGATVGDPIQYAAVFALEPSQGAWLARMGLSGANNTVAQDLLGHYTYLVNLAAAETSDFEKRFETFAEAEFHLLYEYAVVVPGLVDARQQVVVSRILPYTQLRDPLGIAHRMRKHQVMLPANVTVTRSQGEALRAAWLSGSNAELNVVINSIMAQFN